MERIILINTQVIEGGLSERSVVRDMKYSGGDVRRAVGKQTTHLLHSEYIRV